MKAAILTVGTEILFGEITNTNTVFLSRRLNDIGIDVMYHYTVGDNPVRLAEMIETSLKTAISSLLRAVLGLRRMT